MSEIDYRQIIDTTLPKIAAEIMEKCLQGIGHGVDYRTTTQSSYGTQADYSRPLYRETNKLDDGSYEYVYMPYRKPDAPNYRFKGRNPRIANECRMAFRHLRVTDIIDRKYGPLDKVPNGALEVDTESHPNPSPEPVHYAIQEGVKDWTEWGQNWELAIESELSQTIKAGSELYGVESETSLKVTASASTGGEKKGGTEKHEDHDARTIIEPNHQLDVITKRQPVLVSQDITLTGTLEFSCDVVLEHMWGESLATYAALLDMFRGVGAGNERLRDWFSDPSHEIPEDVLNSIDVPVVTINLGMHGVPADDVTQETNQYPLSEAHNGGSQ